MENLLNEARVASYLELAAYTALDVRFQMDKKTFMTLAGIWFDEVERLSKEQDNA